MVAQHTNKSIVDEALKSINGASDLVLSGNKLTADLDNAITDTSIERTIDGAPTLTLSLNDPVGAVRNSGIFGNRTTVKVDAFTFEVAQISKSGEALTITCEDQVVAELREHNSILKVAAGKMTHVQFAQMICKEVPFIKFHTVPDPSKYHVIRSLEALTRGTVNKKGKASLVDSWTCLNDLANARGWRCFVRGVDQLWYVPDSYLFAAAADFQLSEADPGIQAIDFDWDKGKKVATCTVTCTAGLWEIPPGVTVQLHDMGPANGKWLVQDISKSLNSLTTTVTLIHPRPILPEPKPASGSSGGSDAGGYEPLTDAELSSSAAVRVAQYAIDAGFTGSGLETAVAVSFAEDGSHDPRATNTNSDGSVDRGLWQINNKAHPNYSDSYVFDPGDNAQAAYAISDGGKNWKPWTTFNNGAYLKYIPAAKNAIASAKKLMQRNTGANTATAFANLALSQKGKAYIYGAPVLPGSADPKSFDCSSLVAWCADRLGVNLTAKGIRTAAQEWDYCRSKGGDISVQQAINTRGALVFENDPPSHVVISLGNGDTIEAMGTAYGVRVGGFAGRNWTHGAKLPGLNY
ncbi:MAG TPA: NlpC/P60 family protein [Nocardioidaceae bacterium]|nr:NlpC/P60 family protein [Nocardioidaceae bacterium]